jgi:hypothetical protein
MVESKPNSAQQFVNQIGRLAARKAAEVGSGSAGVSTQTDDALNVMTGRDPWASFGGTRCAGSRGRPAQGRARRLGRDNEH